MKTRFFVSVILFLGFVMVGNAQDYSKLKDIELKEKEDFAKAEDKILECSKYILTTPVDDENTNRINALKFMFRWMDGTPEYTFTLDETVDKLGQTNDALLGVYMACMSRYVLENKDKAKDEKDVKYNSVLMLIDYARDPNNKVEITGEIENLIKAKDEHRLKEYIKVVEGQLV
jgi:CRISPR/Cas system CMR-associated protein Cmr5 small subunit